MKLPHLDELFLAVSSSFPVLRRIHTGVSAFALAEALELLPGQPNVARLSLEDFDLRNLILDKKNDYCSISQRPLLRLIIDHFSSIRVDGDQIHTRTDVGSFTFPSSRFGQVVHFNSRDRAARVLLPKGQPFEAVRRCASGLFQRRKDANFLAGADNSCIPLTWEPMDLETALFQLDLEHPRCLRFTTQKFLDEMHFHHTYTSTASKNFIRVVEALPAKFESLGESKPHFQLVMDMRGKQIIEDSHMKVVVGAVSFGVSAALSLMHRNAESAARLQTESVQTARVMDLYQQHLNAFQRTRYETSLY